MVKLTTFQIILLAVFGACAVSGVLVFSFLVGGAKNSSVGAVTIWGTFDKQSFDSVIAGLDDNDKSFDGVTYTQVDSASYESTLTNALANGSGPDLFIMRQDSALQDYGKVVQTPYTEIPVSQFQGTFVPSTNVFLGADGVLAMPLVADPLVLYYNVDMLSSAGYSLPPRYWDELLAMSDKITKKTDAGDIIKSTVALGEYDNVHDAKDILAALIMQAGGQIATVDTTSNRYQPALSIGANGQATFAALSFFTQFSDPTKTSGYTWNHSLPDSQDSFAAGDLALYIGFASERKAIAAKNPNLNFGIAALPQIRRTADANDPDVSVARIYAIGISRTTRNYSGAKTIASLLAAAGGSQIVSSA